MTLRMMGYRDTGNQVEIVTLNLFLSWECIFFLCGNMVHLMSILMYFLIYMDDLVNVLSSGVYCDEQPFFYLR